MIENCYKIIYTEATRVFNKIFNFSLSKNLINEEWHIRKPHSKAPTLLVQQPIKSSLQIPIYSLIALIVFLNHQKPWGNEFQFTFKFAQKNITIKILWDKSKKPISIFQSSECEWNASYTYLSMEYKKITWLDFLFDLTLVESC